VLIRERMASEHAPRIPEVTAHLVDAGGKRIRPMLTLAAARLCGYAGTDHRKLAATVEFIHTATLLHDDVVDESQRRRGRPTANLLWDNKSSVLVGDYLFARAFQLMVETQNLRVLDILSNAAATIAEGEVLQLTAAMNLATTEDIYLQVIRGKTAALFEAACEVGGVIADQPEPVVTALARYGDGLGIAFQMADDLLDWGGTSGAIGKNTGDDFRERKLTLPVIRAVARPTRRNAPSGCGPSKRANRATAISTRRWRSCAVTARWTNPGRGTSLRRRCPQRAGRGAAARVDRDDGGSGRLRGCAPDLTVGRWIRAPQSGRAPERPTSRAVALQSHFAAARSASASVNSPKQVAPDPLIRDKRHPSVASRAVRTSPTIGTRDCAAGSRSFRVVRKPSQQAVGIGPARIRQRALSTVESALNTGPVGTSTPGFTRTIQKDGIGGTGWRMSPMPRMRAGVAATQTGMSAPMAEHVPGIRQGNAP
jgi:geranylgeranyl pyrophosphate synthase